MNNKTDPALDELRDELGSELMRRAQLDAQRSSPSLRRRLLPWLGAVALVGAGAGVAVAASDDGPDTPPARVDPTLTAIGLVNGEQINFACAAESQWFFEAIGGDIKEFEASGAAIPTPPEDICDGQPPIDTAP